MCLSLVDHKQKFYFVVVPIKIYKKHLTCLKTKMQRSILIGKNMKKDKTLNDFMGRFKFKAFNKDSRSTFQYWYYHWKAFNLTAWYLNCWKVKYLFHDIEKPWLKLFWEYKRVQQWHRIHNSHHSEYKGGIDKIDWKGLIIDNECSRFTKAQAQMSAREYISYVINEKHGVNANLKQAYVDKCLPLLEKLGL